jgi:LPS export ABC transporter protein LptC/lipopolysaccharide transport protein LptA
LIAVFAAAFAVVVLLAFRRHGPSRSAGAPLVRAAPGAVIETTGGDTRRVTGSREGFDLKYVKLLTYADGSTRLQGVTIVTDQKDGGRTFTVTAKEGQRRNESLMALDGDVQMTASDGLTVRTEHATYSESDDTVRAPGPVSFARGRMSGTGNGMRYEKARDLLTILDQAVVHIAPDEGGAGDVEVSSGTAGVARRDKFIQFDRDVRIRRGAQTTQADASVAHLSPDEKHIETMELHGNARISTAGAGAGALEALSGHDMNLTYGPDGQSLQHALIVGDGVAKLAGEAGKPGRQIVAKSLEIGLAPDGATPVVLTGREAVELTFPPEPGTPGRVIRAASLDAKGEPGVGLTRAVFTGGVQFREHGADIDRAANSGALDVGLRPGMSSIEDAKFAHAVVFDQGAISALAAAARYDLDKGTLNLTGSEPGALVPHLVNDQISVDATKIDVTLAGPQVAAAGTVKSTLKPAKKGSDSNVKMPSMLKQDQPVTVLADNLVYDGEKSVGTYTGGAQLFQSDTTIKGDTIAVDEKLGDLTATGHAMTITTREQVDKDKKKTRAQSTGTSNDLKYEDGVRKLTYTGGAHLVGPEGDMTATRIELFLKPSGDELDHAEAYADGGDPLTLREQRRTTTGLRLTYTADNETYVVTGLPATVVDECDRPTTGQKLTWVKSTDTITVNGSQQIRTQTRGGGDKCK